DSGLLRCARNDVEEHCANHVIARSSCDEAIQSFRTRDSGLLRCARNDGEGAELHRRISYRSFHSGLRLSIRASFFARLPALICFSREMASYMLSCSSYQTSILQL